MRLKKENFLTSKKFIRFLYHFIGLYSSTFRLTVENEKPWLDHINSGGRVLLCTWHQQFFPFIHYFKNYRVYKPSLMISRSNDGEMIAGVADLTGWYPARGSSSRGGKTALRDMINRVIQTGLGAHIIDGPRGPIGVVKPGAIHLAMESGAVIVPMYSKAEKAWYANSWDRFLVPKPFSKVTIQYGDMIQVEKTNDSTAMEEQRKRLEDIMRPQLQAIG